MSPIPLRNVSTGRRFPLSLHLCTYWSSARFRLSAGLLRVAPSFWELPFRVFPPLLLAERGSCLQATSRQGIRFYQSRKDPEARDIVNWDYVGSTVGASVEKVGDEVRQEVHEATAPDSPAAKPTPGPSNTP
jgi:hypothetical protein